MALCLEMEKTPISTNKRVIIKRINQDTFKFIEHFQNDSLTFTANRNSISSVQGRLDSFTVYGTGFKKETNLKRADTDVVFKSKSPDTEYLAYKIFYWLL